MSALRGWMVAGLSAVMTAAAMVMPAAVASEYPSQPIRLIAPAPAGSLSDSLARTLGTALSEAVKQPVVVENRPGTEGMIAAMTVQRAAPDGYTLLFATNSPMAAVPAMMNTPPYDALEDFTPISRVGFFTFFLYVNAELPIHTFEDLVEYAKKNPGKLTYGTANSTATVGTAQMISQAGLDLLHVPYKGEPQAMLDLVAGRIDLMWATPIRGVPMVKEGKVRAIATSSRERSVILPEVPTIYEAGLPGYSIVSWGGFYGPKGLPEHVVKKLSTALNEIMNNSEIAGQLAAQGVTLSPSSPEDLRAYQVAQIDAWTRTVQEAGIPKN